MSDDESQNNKFTRLKKLSRRAFNRQVGVFLIFLVISTVLWFVTALNEEVTRPVLCSLRIVDVPDSVTFINEPPATVSATVRGRGLQLMRKIMGSKPELRIRFGNYAEPGRLLLSKSAINDLVQSALGDETQVLDIYPDSIRLAYTTRPPVKLPVKVAITATAAPNLHIVEQYIPLTDSVNVYSAGDSAAKLKFVTTADSHFDQVTSSRVVRVPLVVPAGCRAIPDSVDVRIAVEPYVTVNKEHRIELINVPKHMDVSLRPQKVKAAYRVPESRRGEIPDVRILADFATVADSTVTADMIGIYADPWLSYIFLERDSVNYFIDSVSND